MKPGQVQYDRKTKTTIEHTADRTFESKRDCEQAIPAEVQRSAEVLRTGYDMSPFRAIPAVQESRCAQKGSPTVHPEVQRKKIASPDV
jgi:hypothetical protein